MMFKRVLLLAVLLAVLIVPAVAAEVVTSEHIGYERHVDESFTLPYDGGYSWDRNPGLEITFSGDIQHFQDIELLYLGDLSPRCVLNPAVNMSGSTPFTVSNGEISGEIHYNVHFADGKPSKVQVWLTFDHFAPTGTGTVRYVLIYDKDAVSYVNIKGQAKTHYWPPTPFVCFSASEAATGYRPFIGTYIYRYTEKFEHDYVLTEYDDEYVLDVFRHGYKSTIELKDALYDYIQNPNVGTDDFSREIPKLTLEPPIYLNITAIHGDYFYRELLTPSEEPTVVQPCTISVYDADTRLPLAGDWEYYIVVEGSDAVSGSASGAFAVVNLPVTSILKPHLLYVTKEGYEMVPGFVAIDVPAGGREINIYLTPLETTAPDNSSVVTFSVTDIESGAPVHSALVNVDGVAKYVGASGTAWFILPENTSHDWVVSSPNHWPIGGNFTLGVDDLAIPVSLTRKTSDLPRPPLPELPNFPVIHPSLDPAGFRMQILSVPLLGSLASPLLDTVDSLGVGLNDMATAVLDVLTAPADYITGAVSSVGQNLIDTATPYLVTSSLLLQVIGAVVSCIPGQVCGLVTFGLLLDIARILLWGPA